MAHRYGELIRVDVERTGPDGGILRSFTWRGTCYPIVDILGNWHLAARWWDPEKHSDRQYHRVETPGHMVFELYYDQVSGVWMLDVVHD